MPHTFVALDVESEEVDAKEETVGDTPIPVTGLSKKIKSV